MILYKDELKRCIVLRRILKVREMQRVVNRKRLSPKKLRFKYVTTITYWNYCVVKKRSIYRKYYLFRSATEQ